jgi:hypothetical protein
MAGSKQGCKVVPPGIRFFRAARLLTLLLVAQPAAANAQFAFSTNADGVTLTVNGYTGSAGTVIIPDSINGLAVTAIGDGAFAGMGTLTNVTIPSSVTNLGANAFPSCHNLAEVYFLGDAPSADWTAFWGDSATLYYLEGTTGWASFDQSAGFTAVLMPFSYTSTNDAITVTGYLGSGGTVSIPGTIDGLPVTGVGDGAFADYDLTNLSLGTNVISIGNDAFSWCSNLTGAVMPQSVASIGAGAFGNCSSLTGIYFQGNAPGAASNAFSGDPNMTAYYMPGTSGWGLQFAGVATTLWTFPDYNYTANDGAVTIVRYTGSGGAVTVPEMINGLPVTGIEDLSFFECTALTAVTIPANITDIPADAFYYCANLANVTISSSVTNIEDDAFAGCFNLTAVYFLGNAIAADPAAFFGDNKALIYYLPGTTGWGATFDGCPTALLPFVYTTSNGAITITQYAGTSNNVSIPATINGLPVTTIASPEFGILGYNSTVTNVTIPYTVTNIGLWAFEYSILGGGTPTPVLSSINVDPNNPVFSSMNGVLMNKAYGSIILYPWGRPGNEYTIPSTVTNIATEAFYFCTNLNKVTIPDGVTIIRNQAFQFDINLADVEMGSNIVLIGIEAFWECGLTNLTLPSSVRAIEQEALLGCWNLTSVTFGNGNCSIGQQAFMDCTSLTKVTLGSGTISVGDEPFFGDSSLTGVYFVGNAPSLNSTVFTGAYNVTAYYLPGSTGWESTFYGQSTALWPFPDFLYLYNNGAIEIEAYTGSGGAVAIPSTFDGFPVTSIADSAFFECSGLTAVTIPTSVTNIPADAFYYCVNLTDVTVPGNVTSISADAFAGCFSLTGVYFLGNPPSVDPTAFSGDNDATAYYLYGTTGWGPTLAGIPAALNPYSYTITNNAITLTAYVGSGGAATIPDTINGVPITAIGNGAFSNTPITSVTIGTNVASIGMRAFSGCNLTAVTIPNSVANIGPQAFYDCTNLASVTMGKGVASIGTTAFFGDSQLTGVYFEGNAPTPNPVAFANAHNATIYYLPGAAGWGSTFDGRPTALWLPRMQIGDGSLGLLSNQFGFNVTWASGGTVVVEACTNLFSPVWIPLATNTLTGGPLYFSDAQWSNYPARFYRITTP